jgi:hypothetical protein
MVVVTPGDRYMETVSATDLETRKGELLATSRSANSSRVQRWLSLSFRVGVRWATGAPAASRVNNALPAEVLMRARYELDVTAVLEANAAGIVLLCSVLDLAICEFFAIPADRRGGRGNLAPRTAPPPHLSELIQPIA